MNLQNFAVRLAIIALFLTTQTFSIARAAGSNEFIGQFDTALAANKENLERIIFKFADKNSI